VAYADTAGTHKQSVHKHDKNVYTNETKLGNRAEKFIKTKLETNAPDKRSEMHLHTHPSTLVA